MSKYIIELKDDVQVVQKVGVTENGNAFVMNFYKDQLEELNSDYINEHYGDLQDEAYQQDMMDEEIRQAVSEVREMKQMCGNINMKLTNIVTQRGQDIKKKLEAEYQRGLDDAWEAARKLFSLMADSDMEKAFPIEWNNGGFNALMNLQPQEAIEKLKAYEEKQKADDEIKVGDEVIYNDTMKCLVVRPESNDKYAVLIDSNGNHHHAEHSECKKTGRHFDIASILKEMQTQ